MTCTEWPASPNSKYDLDRNILYDTNTRDLCMALKFSIWVPLILSRTLICVIFWAYLDILFFQSTKFFFLKSVMII